MACGCTHGTVDEQDVVHYIWEFCGYHWIGGQVDIVGSGAMTLFTCMFIRSGKRTLKEHKNPRDSTCVINYSQQSGGQWTVSETCDP